MEGECFPEKKNCHWKRRRNRLEHCSLKRTMKVPHLIAVLLSTIPASCSNMGWHARYGEGCLQYLLCLLSNHLICFIKFLPVNFVQNSPFKELFSKHYLLSYHQNILRSSYSRFSRIARFTRITRILLPYHHKV